MDEYNFTCEGGVGINVCTMKLSVCIYIYAKVVWIWLCEVKLPFDKTPYVCEE